MITLCSKRLLDANNLQIAINNPIYLLNFDEVNEVRKRDKNIWKR